jgi:hypothetical protein
MGVFLKCEMAKRGIVCHRYSIEAGKERKAGMEDGERNTSAVWTTHHVLPKVFAPFFSANLRSCAALNYKRMTPSA